MPRPQPSALLVPTFVLAAMLMAAPLAVRAEEPAPTPQPTAAPGSVDEARECAQRNLPHQTVQLRATFTKVDRVGGERVSRAKVMGKKLEDGLHRVVLRFDKPIDVRGTAMLMIENPSGPSDFYVWSPDERRTRRVANRGSGGLFGTDFTYDDFENWRGFSRRGGAERLPDAEEAGRPVYVLQTTPTPEDGSIYERVTSYVDKQSCVVLRIDSFEPNAKLRKVMRADPASVKAYGPMFLATEVVLEDVLDQTKTSVKLDGVQLDVEIPDGRFRPTDLGS